MRGFLVCNVEFEEFPGLTTEGFRGGQSTARCLGVGAGDGPNQWFFGFSAPIE